MNEFIDVLLKVAGMLIVAFATYVVVPAIKDWRNTRLNEKQREELTFWVETGVLWAKQWLQSASGEKKKQEVFFFVQEKIKELKLPYTDDDIDKAIEAFYGTIKDVVNSATGEDTLSVTGGGNIVSD